MPHDDYDRDDIDDELLRKLFRVHPVRRLSLLAMTIVECNSTDTRAAVRGFLAMAEAMTKLHGAKTRGLISCDVRDSADRIEQSVTLN